jgi:hypothetical protein
MVSVGKVIVLLLACAFATEVKLATFDGAKETTLTWNPVNDPVMGGQSTSTFNVEASKGIFEGEVKVVTFLGAPGFCNLETSGTVSFPDVSDTDGIVVTAKQTLEGGLKNFDVRLTTTQTDAAKRGASWGADFEVADGQDSYFVPYSAFTCLFRGQTLKTCGNIADQLSSVTQLVVGSGGVAGPFRLELTSFAAATKELQAASDEIVLESFDAAVHTWNAQNDPVMGGQSTSTFTIQDGVGTLNGTCAIVPKLSAPGFITARTSDSIKFPDISNCAGLSITSKSQSTPANYDGYRISFGSDSSFSSCGKFFARGFKSDFAAGEGEFKTVQIPFDMFTKCWDDATGDAVKACKDFPEFCPSQTRLSDLQSISIWAEGKEADVKLDVQKIAAYGCSATETVV